MKSIVLRLALALAALTIVPNALAADSDGGNFFLDGKVGKGSNTTEFTDTGPSTQTRFSWGTDGGYLWNLDDARSLGLDVGYMHFGSVADSVDFNGFFTEAVSATAMTAGGRFRYLFSDDRTWYLQAHTGLMRVTFDSSTDSYPPVGAPTTFSDSWSEIGAYLGAGIGRQITQSFSLGVAYTRYSSVGTRHIDLNMDWIGLEAGYRF